VLDLCTGTGDLALALAEAAGSGVEVVAVDFSRPMLDRAAFKIRDARRSVTLVRASAAALPFGAGTVDVVGTSFALRNLVFENPFGRAHLAEIARVLRPGGRFVAVETSQPASPVVRRLYHLFLQLSSRRLGGLLSGVPPAYGYLARSATRFPGPAGVRDLLLSAGFRSVTSRALLLGAVALHEAVV
jgi:demethylmenaquinone methyltransferase/2-methoxy-6-polyprenyl-1,4-benzoquinol methylase